MWMEMFLTHLTVQYVQVAYVCICMFIGRFWKVGVHLKCDHSKESY